MVPSGQELGEANHHYCLNESYCFIVQMDNFLNRVGNLLIHLLILLKMQKHIQAKLS